MLELVPDEPDKTRVRPDRNPRDFYETPEWVTRILVERLHQDSRHLLVGEPCAGEGAIVRVLRSAGFDVRASDLYPKEGIEQCDATQSLGLCTTHRGVGMFVTNPPFRLAARIVGNILWNADSRIPVWLLLRLSFLEPAKERRQFLEEGPEVIVLPKRPKFSGAKGSDMATCAWFGWNTGRGGTIRWPK